MGKKSQLLLKPTEVELGLQVGVEFDKMLQIPIYFFINSTTKLFYRYKVQKEDSKTSYQSLILQELSDI